MTTDPSDLEASNHVEQQISLGSENLSLTDKHDFAIVKHEPIASFAAVANIVPRVHFALVHNDTAELVHKSICRAVDVVICHGDTGCLCRAQSRLVGGGVRIDI